jgi:hypothetical protein
MEEVGAQLADEEGPDSSGGDIFLGSVCVDEKQSEQLFDRI